MRLLPHVALSIAFSLAVQTFAGDIDLGPAGHDQIIVFDGDSPIAMSAVSRLTDYIRNLTGKAPALRRTADDAARAMVIGDAKLAEKFGIEPPAERRDESYSIAPATRGNANLLIISGRTDKGIKQAIYHVLKNLAIEGDKLVLHDAPIRFSPAIKLRVSHVGGAMGQARDRETGARLPRAIASTPAQLDWNMIARWDAQRLGDYVDMLDFFGYNGIEEPPTFYVPTDQSAEMTQRRQAVREHLLRNGQIGVAKIDGTVLGAGTYTTNIPWTAQTSDRYEKYYRGMAETAGPYNDIVLTHWVDPGGWPSTPDHPCTIQMLQDLHMQIFAEFKRVNPKAQSFLSLWNMQNPQYKRWQGYDGVETILSSGKIPGDVGFTQSRVYRAEEARKILAAGHPLGIWGWYLADNELTYTMHVHTHLLKSAMDALPPDAQETVSFYSMDNCQREFNIYSTYVAGQLLCEPASDPEAHLRDIARIIYGPKLHQPVFQALKAIADVRCGKQCRGYFNPQNELSQDDALNQATAAWNGLKDVQIDQQYIPPIRFHRAPDVLLEELKDQVHAVATYMQYLKDGKTEVPRAAGPFETYERLEYLQARNQPSKPRP
jgi:hypothetical protein